MRTPATCVIVSFLVCATGFAARAEGWAPNLTLGTRWNDNATNANTPSDRIAALQANADLLASERYGLTKDDSLHLGFHAGAEWWPRFGGLSRGALGARAEWQHKFGLGALVPVFSVELAADAVGAKESGRGGTSAGVTVVLRKRFDDRWRATFSHEATRYDARFAVFDRRGNETAVEIGRELDELSSFTFRVNYRRGDVLSYGTPPRPDLVALAPNRLMVDTFERPMVAYSIDARSVGAKATVIRALDENSSLMLGYEWRDTEHKPLRYVNHLVSLSLVHQF
jgi:hypothetical protein